MSQQENDSKAVNDKQFNKQLNCCVRELMESYFSDLEGHKPRDLYQAVLNEIERPLLEVVLNECGHNRTEASQILGINRGTLLKKLKHHQLT